jgi:hypothetical protein
MTSTKSGAGGASSNGAAGGASSGAASANGTARYQSDKVRVAIIGVGNCASRHSGCRA